MEPPPPQSRRRLEHEYSLADELEPAWAAKPLALTRYEGRTILVLADPGGEPLDRVLERDREAISGTMKFARGRSLWRIHAAERWHKPKVWVVSERTLPRLAAVPKNALRW